ncbi:hypothetical protein AK830_g1731 [Neonectria ditissima]|uniref:Uncharacterized protein n=1 Tax=Neonectria ditissima TaxID=78410 RepID=A0A0P7BWE1_9HYPO|nr:hypothetical protein AK830_g1731 [Neonectria ditissima]
MISYEDSEEYQAYKNNNVRPDKSLLPPLTANDHGEAILARGELYCRYRDFYGTICPEESPFLTNESLDQHYNVHHDQAIESRELTGWMKVAFELQTIYWYKAVMKGVANRWVPPSCRWDTWFMEEMPDLDGPPARFPGDGSFDMNDDDDSIGEEDGSLDEEDYYIGEQDDGLVKHVCIFDMDDDASGEEGDTSDEEDDTSDEESDVSNEEGDASDELFDASDELADAPGKQYDASEDTTSEGTASDDEGDPFYDDCDRLGEDCDHLQDEMDLLDEGTAPNWWIEWR